MYLVHALVIATGMDEIITDVMMMRAVTKLVNESMNMRTPNAPYLTSPSFFATPSFRTLGAEARSKQASH